MLRQSGAMQRGQAIVLVALMMSVLLGFVALGIDSGRAFDTRRALQDAVDAAALTAADYYANSGSAASSATLGAQLFAKDLRLYPTSDASCSGLSSPAQGQTVSAACTVPSPAALTVYMTAQGALGQTFTYDAHYSISLAMMQVLGLNPSVTLQAKASASTGDQTLTPAVGTLGGCSGTTVNVTSSSSVTVFGDLVANGLVNADGSSSVKVAGNLVSRCGAATGPWSYACWQANPPIPWAAPGSAPCSSPGTLAGTNLVGAGFADPGLSPPSTSGLTGLGWPGWPNYPAVASPGVYSDPNIGPLVSGNNYPCYFLQPGVYQFTSGFTLRSGLVSNELRPPDPNPKRTPYYPFWAQGASTGSDPGAHCIGDVRAVPVSAASNPIPMTGNWAFQVTSIRTTDAVGGTSYTRESAASNCHQVTIGSGQAVSFTISNVPGAQGYNVYAAPPAAGGCSAAPNSAYGWVATFKICPSGPAPNCGTITSSCPSGLWAAYCQSNQTVSGCPDTVHTPQQNCSLGQLAFTVDGSASMLSSTWKVNNAYAAWTSGAAMPDDPMGRWVSGAITPSLEPPRGDPSAAPATGDLANGNLCADPSSSALGHRSTCPGKVTPGGVIFYLSGGCYNVQSSGDSFIFSGPQFNWVAIYEPASTSCTNTLNALYNSGFEGMFYAPGASLTFSSQLALQTPAVGGIAVRALNISGASNLTISYDPDYAPFVPAARLTG
jgi:hypothetical protein